MNNREIHTQICLKMHREAKRNQTKKNPCAHSQKKKNKNVFKKIGKNSNHCAAAVAAAETTTKPNFYNNM